MTSKHNIDATRPREIEYAWAKALAYGAAMSLETHYDDLRGNGRTTEILSLIRRWEELRLSNYFSDTVRDQLKVLGKEFTLKPSTEGNWKVLPITYHENKGGNDWTFHNPYATQHAFISIDTGPSAAPII
ncbi:MAG TPA: hypothetical protein VF788_06735, partial [Pseudonocardiaceae bacterium]